MEAIYCSLIGYLIGTINPAFFMGKKRGFDIREKGSGNPGASNVVILFGKAKGVLCALLDITKTCFAIWLAKLLFPTFTRAFAVTSAFCILGHVFPFYMKFKGGKGLACLGGVVLMYDWRVFLVMLAVEVVIALLTDYICFVPMTASIIFPITYTALTKDLWGTMLLALAGAVIFIRHIENIRRIRSGKEAHLSFLWNKNAELERLKHNIDHS